MPPASARRLLSDGLAKVGRIAASCRPTLFLSTATYIRLKWLSSKVLGAGTADSPTRWPGEWIWKSTDDLSARLAAADRVWLVEFLQRRRNGAGDEVSFLQFTSGSTGHPKGVVVGTANLMADRRRATPPGGPIAVVSWLLQYHDMGLIGGCLLPMACGYESDLLSPMSFLQRPAVWLEAITRLRDTHTVAAEWSHPAKAPLGSKGRVGAN